MQVWRQTASSGELVACVWAVVVDVVGVDRAGSGRPGAGSKACANVLHVLCICDLGGRCRHTGEGQGDGCVCHMCEHMCEICYRMARTATDDPCNDLEHMEAVALTHALCSPTCTGSPSVGRSPRACPSPRLGCS